jgi:hypothetical protein
MSAATSRLLLSLGAAAGYALMMGANPVRGSLRDGLRCIGRYKQVWSILAFCAVAAAAFVLAVRCYEWRTVPGAEPPLNPWIGWHPVAMGAIAAASLVPALLSVAAVFDCLVTLFPLSVIAAVLFLCNWRGYQAVLYRGIIRRLGLAAGIAVHFGLIGCGIAELAKPILFFCQAQLLAAHIDQHELALAGAVIYWLSFAFEYFLGVGLQIYLALLCFAWVRGLTFDFDKLRRFALRRFAFVIKWAVLVLALSSVGIDLPVVLESVLDGERAWLARTIAISQAILPLILVAFCSMQLTLIFHNESLRRAFADHFRFLRRHAARVGWLVLIAGLHFYVLNLAGGILSGACGTSTWPAVAWRLLVFPLVWAALGAWFLASWVCLFRRCETNRPDVEELVQF